MSKSKDILSVKQLIKAGGLPGALLFGYYILIFFIKRRRTLDNYADVDAAALLQVFFVVVVFGLALHTFLFKTTSQFRFVTLQPNKWLLLYIIICLLSVFWTPNLNITLYRAFETLTFLVLISWTVHTLFIKLDAQNMLEWMVLWAVWTIIWSVATNVKLIGLGFLSNPFDAARLDYPVAIFFALLISKRQWMRALVLILALLSFSNKIYLGFALGLAGFLVGNIKYKGLLFFGIVGLIVILNFINFEELLIRTIFIGREEVDIEQSSGRYYIWQLSWEAFKDSPFIGHGFVAGENEVLYSKFQGAINTHSFIFSGLLGTGILGTTFLLGYFGAVVKMGLKGVWPKDRWKPAIVGTIIMSIVVSLTAPGVGSRVYGSWISVVLVFTMICGLYYKFKLEKRQKQLYT